MARSPMAPSKVLKSTCASLRRDDGLGAQSVLSARNVSYAPVLPPRVTTSMSAGSAAPESASTPPSAARSRVARLRGFSPSSTPTSAHRTVLPLKISRSSRIDRPATGLLGLTTTTTASLNIGRLSSAHLPAGCQLRQLLRDQVGRHRRAGGADDEDLIPRYVPPATHCDDRLGVVARLM